MKQDVVKFSAFPLKHEYDASGPVVFSIGKTVQPPFVRAWDVSRKSKCRPSFGLVQPNEDDNLTLLYVYFAKPFSKRPSQLKGVKLYRCTNLKRRANEALELGVKARICLTLPHPVPLREWQGTVSYDETERWALYLLQNTTLRKATRREKPGAIVQPGDPDFVIPERFEDQVRPLAGLGRGGTDAG